MNATITFGKITKSETMLECEASAAKEATAAWISEYWGFISQNHDEKWRVPDTTSNDQDIALQ